MNEVTTNRTIPFPRFEADRVPTRYCEKPGCSSHTMEKKPFCSDHVEDHPYVKNLLQRLAMREAQDEKVIKKGHKGIEANAVTQQEIIQYLEYHGTKTVEHLARFINVDIRVIQVYVKSMVESGLVTTKLNKRKSTLVKLVKP